MHQQGFPEPARQYLFFLKSQPESADFYIVTGYELNSGKVQPLDGVGFNKTEYSQFAQYQGVEEVSFLSQVVQEINAEPGAARFAAVDFHACDIYELAAASYCGFHNGAVTMLVVDPIWPLKHAARLDPIT